MHKATRNLAPAKQSSIGVQKTDSLSVMLLCAGPGRKIKLHGPRSTWLINGMTLIQRQIHNIWNVHPEADIIIVTGFGHNEIVPILKPQYSVRIIHNHLYAEHNVGYSIKLGLNASCCKNCLVICGDMMFNTKALDGVACGDRSCVVVDNKAMMEDHKLGIGSHKEIVSSFSYGLTQKWGQIIYFAQPQLNALFSLLSKTKTYRWTMGEILNALLKEKHVFRTMESSKQYLKELNGYNDKDTIVC